MCKLYLSLVKCQALSPLLALDCCCVQVLSKRCDVAWFRKLGFSPPFAELVAKPFEKHLALVLPRFSVSVRAFLSKCYGLTK